MSIMESVITGIVAGLIASGLFYFFMYRVKPKIVVANELCLNIDKAGKAILQIKVVNKTKSMIMNVGYYLFLDTRHDHDIVNRVEIVPTRENKLNCIEKLDKKDQDAEYAVILSYEIDPTILDEKDNSLSFVIYGSHVVSNTTCCVKKRYSKSDIVKNGMYQRETSLIILKK